MLTCCCGQNQQQKQNDVMLYLFLTLNRFSRLMKFFIVNFGHVFVSLAQDKVHKKTHVHINQ